MKKKVLYGFAMALIASVSMGTLQSCKDDLSDFKHQDAYDKAYLQDQITKNKAELLDSIRVHRNDINKLIKDLNQYATINYVDNLYKEALKADSIAADSLNNKINGAIKRLNSDSIRIDNLSARLDTIDSVCYNRWFQLKGKVEAQDTAINIIKNTLANHKERLDADSLRIDSLEIKYTALYNKVDTLSQSVDELWQEIAMTNQNLGMLASNIQAMMDEIDTLENKYNALEGRVNDIFKKFDYLYGQVQNLITGIIIQAAQGPVFGSLNTPLGIQSNILFNWYGYNDVEAFDFPSASADYNYYEAAPVLTQTELDALSPEYKNVKKGVLGDVNLGKLYMTINPAGNYFNENGFVLESSAEKQYPVTLTVKKSTDELTFGYTRATVEGNGFYEADVVVKEDDIDAAKMEIESGLKSSVEDALKDPSKRTAIGLLKGVYSQFNGTLPAYAVRYNWTAKDSLGNDKDYSVLSKYEVAATTAKPLSYAFLYGKGSDKKVPTYGHINNFINRFKEKLNDNLTFTFDNNIKVDGKEISWRRVDNFREAGDHIEATVVGLTVDGKVYPDFTVNCGSDPEKVSEMITAGLIEKIWGANVTDAIKTEAYAKVTVTLLEMQKQIAEVINEINGTVDKAVDDAFNQVESYAKHVNRIIDLYNKVANKINGFLKNPNHYLQVAMFYNQADSKMGLLSNTLKSPTVFTRGNGNVGLYASSYTGELVCPAYMKYVACTNVYDAETKQPVAGEAAAVNAAAKNFNTVMTGNTIRYSVPASALKDGRIYEIVYQGVDYSGRTSTQKFYIQVK